MRSQVIKLRSEVSTVRLQVSKLRSEVSKLRSQVIKLRSQVSKLRSQVIKLRSQLNNWRSQVSNFRSLVSKYSLSTHIYCTTTKCTGCMAPNIHPWDQLWTIIITNKKKKIHYSINKAPVCMSEKANVLNVMTIKQINWFRRKVFPTK